MVESQLSENQAFYASYRRSLIDRFLDKEDASDEDEGIAVDKLPVIDDYQFKYHWAINSNHLLSAVAAGARDDVAATFNQNSNAGLRDPDFIGPAAIKMGFDSQGLAWEWIPGKGERRLKTLFSHITDDFDISYGTGQFLLIDTERQILKSEYGHMLADQHWLTLGASAERADYDASINIKFVPCDSFMPDCPTIDAKLVPFKQQLQIQTNIVYLEDQWQLSDALNLTSGLHFTEDDYLNESTLEPRFHIDYDLNRNWSINAAVGQYSQLPNLDEMLEEIGNPDLEYIHAVHYVMGLEHTLHDDWSWHSDLYYKKLDNIVISATADPELRDIRKNYTNNASGAAYGIELLVDKKLSNKWYGWLALSLSKTKRENGYTNETRPFDYDRPVILNLVANYQLSELWLLGFKWSLQSGALYTPIPDVKFNENNPDVPEPIYGELNSERLPSYHRLDIWAEYTKPTDYGYWSFFVDLLNAYNQENIEGYELSPNGHDLDSSTPDGFGSNVPVRSITGISFFPSIGFEIQF